MAMLTVTLVASLAAASIWQQFRAVAVESSERSRVQASALLVGALDWARLILREDLRSSTIDHLGEPWAIGLEESRLSSFLAADRANSAMLDDSDDVFLSGQINDLQARFNVTSLVDGGRISAANMVTWLRLFAHFDLPQAEARAVAENLRFASDNSAQGIGTTRAPLRATRIEDLQRLGLKPPTFIKLMPHLSVLPVPTPINVNTASAELIHASLPSVDIGLARRLVSQRDRNPFRSLADLVKIAPSAAGEVNESRHSVSSKYFDVMGRLRTGDISTQERSVVQRESLNDVRIVWRERSSSSQSLLNAPGKPASALLQSFN